MGSSFGTDTVATIRKAKGKRKVCLPSAAAMPCSQRSPALCAYFEQMGATAEPAAAAAKAAARAARRQEMREARELAESLVASSEEAERTAAQEARQEEQEAFEADARPREPLSKWSMRSMVASRL